MQTLTPGARTVERWLAVGQSSSADPITAGQAATSLALDGSDQPQLLIVFCSDAYDLTALLGAINATSGGLPLVGCSTAGEIATDGPGDAGVVVVALGGSGFTARTVAVTGVSSRLRAAGAEAALVADDLDVDSHRLLLLLTDGLAGNQQDVVRGAYSVLGAGVPLVGGCAGDDLKMRQTAQLYGDRVLYDSIVAVGLASTSPFGIGVRHGWRRTGKSMHVTSSANNRVYSLDDEPALDVYLDRLGALAEARTDPTAFTQFALTHPLGIRRHSGEEVRFVGEADFADRSLGCIAEVPQGGLAWFMEGDENSVLEATDAACQEALDQLGGRAPVGMLAFDCVARRGVLGDEGIRREISRVAEHAAGAPVAGFYTYGEIARTEGISGFHNQTLVVLALS